MKNFLLSDVESEQSPGQSAPTKANDEERLKAIREALQKPGAVITGIGSRETPKGDLRLLTNIARAAEAKGMTGRSGGAGGADLAFERGFSDPRNVDVILPWKSFLPKGMTREDVNEFLGRERPVHGPGAGVMLQGPYVKQALDMAEQYHPAWDKCSDGAKTLHSRNMPQVLGMQLDRPADLVVAWTKDGKATGGTGQAIRIAEDIGVPVANLKNPAERREVLKALGVADPVLQMQQQAQQGFSR